MAGISRDLLFCGFSSSFPAENKDFLDEDDEDEL